MARPERATVEVVHALPDRQQVVVVDFSDGLTAEAAVVASGILETFPALAGQRLDLGVYGRPVDGEHCLKPGDRVEIYRPLAADPREARRRAVAASRGKPLRGGTRPAGRDQPPDGGTGA